MAQLPRIFKCSLLDRLSPLLFIGFWAFAVVGILVGLLGPKGLWASLFFVPFFLLGIIQFVVTGWLVEIDMEGIQFSLLGRQKHLRWDEISAIRSSAFTYAIRLCGPNAKDTIQISAEIQAYPALVEFIRRQRLDLWKINEPKAFGPTWWGPHNIWVALGLGLTAAGILMFLAFQPLIGIGWLLGGVLVVLLMLRVTRGIEIRGDCLLVKYPFRQRSIPAKDITAISFDRTNGRSGLWYSVVVHLVNGEKFVLEHFQAGTPIVYAFLKTWWQNPQVTR
jgi:hypothetical protein